MPQKPNGPPWPDISKGLDQHTAENTLTQRDDALARIDAANASIAKIQADHEAVVADLQAQVNASTKQVLDLTAERDAIKADLAQFVEAAGGTEAGQKLLAAKRLAYLQQQKAALDADIAVLTKGTP